MTPDEMQEPRRRCQAFAADGHLEMYKSTKKYDAGAGRAQYNSPSRQELPM